MNGKRLLKDKKVLFLIDYIYMKNKNGVYTFMKHFIKLMNDIGITVDVASTNYFNNILDLHGLNFKQHYVLEKEYFCDNTIANWTDVISKYTESYQVDLIVTNSFMTASAIEKLGLEDNSIIYTHLSEVLDEKNYSHHPESKQYRRFMSNTNMKIVTQSKELAIEFGKILNKEVMCAYEPIYYTDTINIFKKNGIIVIGTNDKRKNYETMLRYIGLLDIPVTMICNNANITNLHSIVSKYNISQYRIIESIHNDMIGNMISQHKLMLHFAELEVCPYVLLEGMKHIPCIINGNSKWGRSFFSPAIKIDISNEEASLELINNIYNNYEEYELFDNVSYMDICKKQWINILNI